MDFSNILYILAAVMVLMFMVTVHELGHYVAGKIFKFKILEFSIGFGPALFKRTSKKTGEIFSIRAIPLGGYCAFGEDDETDPDDPQAFNNQHPAKRIAVLLSGVAMNFAASLLIAIMVFISAGMFFPSVGSVLPDDVNSAPTDPVFVLKEGDTILAINGRFLYINGDLQSALSGIETGKTFTANIVRDGVRMNVPLVKRAYNHYDQDSPGQIAKDGEGNAIKSEGLGITQSYTSYNLGFWESIEKGFNYCFKMAGVILSFFGKLITGQIGLEGVGGPVTTIETTANIARLGFRPLVEIVVLIGVNLAVFNILPIPALDGMRIVFTVIEWIRKRPIKRSVEAMIHLGGLIFLFGFVILADLLHIFGG